MRSLRSWFPTIGLFSIALLVLGTTAECRAGITKLDVDKWEEQYKESRDLVEKELADGKTGIVAEHYEKIQLGAKIAASNIKFVSGKPGGVNGWYTSVSLLITKGKGNEHHMAFLQVFARQYATTAKDILEDKTAPIFPMETYVNEARMLSLLAEYGQEAVLPVLSFLLEEAKFNEGVKYYAARGMRNFFALATRAENPVEAKDAKERDRAIQSLVVELKRDSQVTDESATERLDGYRVYRRELVRALAVSRYPSVQVDKKQVETALELGRIMVGVRVTPTPRLDERVEAAIGLASMQPDLDKNYQQDYAAWHLCSFTYNYVERFRKSAPEVKKKDVMILYGVKVAEALVSMRDSPKGSKFVKDSCTLCIDMLTNLADPNKGNPNRVTDFLQKNQLGVQTMFKDSRDSVLAAPAAPVKENWEK